MNHNLFYDGDIELMIFQGADDWNLGLDGAYHGWNIELVDLMIDKGANDWNSGLSSACKGTVDDL